MHGQHDALKCTRFIFERFFPTQYSIAEILDAFHSLVVQYFVWSKLFPTKLTINDDFFFRMRKFRPIIPNIIQQCVGFFCVILIDGCGSNSNIPIRIRSIATAQYLMLQSFQNIIVKW